jgi:small-conductance mechanosensitive channel
MNQLTTQPGILQPFFQKSADLIAKLPSLLVGLLIGILVVRLLTYLVKWLLKLSRLEPGMRQVMGSIIETILWFFLTVAILQGVGFANVILFFTSSVAALAIIMAAGGSTLISDIFAGVFIAQDRDFKVGDLVIVGPNSTKGLIEKIDARRTRIRDSDGLIHVLPNTLIERNEWIVEERRGSHDSVGRVKNTASRIKSAVFKTTKLKKK